MRVHTTELENPAKKFEELSVVKLEDALLCANCELIVSDTVQGKCPVCGSSALLSLFRLLGGTLQRPSAESFLRHPNPPKKRIETQVS